MSWQRCSLLNITQYERSAWLGVPLAYHLSSVWKPLEAVCPFCVKVAEFRFPLSIEALHPKSSTWNEPMNFTTAMFSKESIFRFHLLVFGVPTFQYLTSLLGRHYVSMRPSKVPNNQLCYFLVPPNFKQTLFTKKTWKLN